MSKLQNLPHDYSSLRYGFAAKIFKNSIFYEASIYLDRLYDNFLWIATENNAFLIDLNFATIACYSLELQLVLKYQSGYMSQLLPKYIMLKQFNVEIPIIFQEFQKPEVKEQKSLHNFVERRKPQMYSMIDDFIESKKKQLTYSANFSRYFKKMRLQIQTLEMEHFTIFPMKKLIVLLEAIDTIGAFVKGALINQNQQSDLTCKQALQTLKAVFCRMNLAILKTTNAIDQITLFKKPSNFLTEKIVKIPGSSKYLTCFQALTEFQNSDINYLIPEYNVDEDLPLTDYFCFSSHNTYLTGNQLTSDCKVTRYIEDLKKGIKCVQLDVHNEGNNEPIITHALKGKGFCKPISFRLTIQAMDEYLQYHPNHYPVIFSIQNHATRQNQDLMSNILIRQFPRCIITPRQKETFHTLQQSKGKIIIKTSCDFENLKQFRNNSQIPKLKQTRQKFSDPYNNFAGYQNVNYGRSNSIIEGSEIDNESYFGEDTENENQDYKLFLEKISKIKRLKTQFNQHIDENSYLPIEKIAQITCIFKAPKGIQTLKVNPFECTSMIHKKIAKTQKYTIINYTKKAWLRSYPQGSDINSKNYEFLELLARGVQIIALNTQTNDDNNIMMNSYFRAGRKGTMQSMGFVQKPEYLRNSSNSSQSTSYRKPKAFTLAFYTHYNLDIKLYSLQEAKMHESSQLPKTVSFKLTDYNESFLVIKIGSQWVECLPLRFLAHGADKMSNNQQSKGIQHVRTIIGRDFQFEDSGIRILCTFKME